MQRYSFPNDVYKLTDGGYKLVEKTTIVYYRCNICSRDILWNDEWTDEKKEEVKADVDAHHNEHIIPNEPTLSE